jgi:uncharacterized YigZ family protein
VTSSFFTLSGKGKATYKDRGSTFVGLAFPLEKESEVKTCLEEAKKLFPSAGHYCYAWRLGVDGQRQRSNDDGEPSGSAGRPILGQLVSSGVTNALVVAVRYFGGTLLGVGGLMQAYKAAASGAIADSGSEEKHVMVRYTVSFPTEDTSAVMRIIKSYFGRVEHNSYDTLSHLTFSVKEIHRSSVESKISELYRVTLKVLEAET